MNIHKQNHSLTFSSLKKEIPFYHGIVAILGFFLIGLILISFCLNQPFSHLNKDFFIPVHSSTAPSLYLLNSSTTKICRQGSNTQLSLMMDTNNTNVVVADAIIDYPTSTFSFVKVNTIDSVFSFNNDCQYKGKPCQIIRNNPTKGELEIVQSRPTPGINGDAQLLGILTFKCLKETFNNQGEIKVKFIQSDINDSSNLIKDDAEGTNILANATGANILVGQDNPIKIQILGLQGKKHKTKNVKAKIEIYPLNKNTKLNEKDIEIGQGWEKSNVDFVLPKNKYKFKVVVPGYLPQKVTLNLATSSVLSIPMLLAGDLNGDGIVNSLDWSKMEKEWHQPDANSDFNDDGVVNTLDWSLMNKNWMVSSKN